MQALRKIVEVRNNLLQIELPNDFNTDKVEVIILPFEEQKMQKKSIADLRGKLRLTQTQYNDFQKEVENSRGEWDRNI